MEWYRIMQIEFNTCKIALSKWPCSSQQRVAQCELERDILRQEQWKITNSNSLHRKAKGKRGKFQGGKCRGYEANARMLSYGRVALLSRQSIGATLLSCRWWFVPWRLMTWGEQKKLVKFDFFRLPNSTYSCVEFWKHWASASSCGVTGVWGN